MHFLLKVSFFIVIGLLCHACENTESEALSENTGLPDDFSAFYVKFHRDTAFQRSHIVWPLKGLAAGLETEGETTWARDEWVPHIRIPSSMEYDQTFNVLTDDLVVETIREKDGNDAMQRRFAKLADGWALIYYVEMQPTKRPD